MRLTDVPDAMIGEGRYWATSLEIRRAAGASAPSVRAAARRWRDRRCAFSPVRGLYVFVPAEYRRRGAPPAEWYIDAAMRHLGRSYYVGLLSAAARHGAAHHAAQAMQVVVNRQVPAREVGRSRIEFLVSSRADAVPVEVVNTPTGTMRVSSPETTALDLIERAPDAGGFALVPTVLAELSDRLDAARLARAARHYPSSVVARLGYVLDQVAGKRDWTRLRRRALRRDEPVALDARRPRRGVRDTDWGVIVNVRVESDA